MKKTLIALAALAAAGASFAQVNLTGEVRAGYQKAPVGQGLVLTDATIKIDVKEDLGGGMTAAAGIQFDQNSSAFATGATTTTTSAQNTLGGVTNTGTVTGSSNASAGGLNRRNTYLSLTTAVGVIRFDQTRSTDGLTKGLVAPTNLDRGIYDSGILVRGGVDALTYGLAMGPLSANIQYVDGTSDGNVTPEQNSWVLGLGYADGPLAAGFAYKTSQYRTSYAVPASLIARSINMEAWATYDFGVAKVGLGWDSAMAGNPNIATGTTFTATDLAVSNTAGYGIGVSVPVTPAVTLGVNYAARDVRTMTEYAMNYALSKRTSFNVSYGYLQKDVSANTYDGYQYRMSMSHKF
jgi:hypothetical protein